MHAMRAPSSLHLLLGCQGDMQGEKPNWQRQQSEENGDQEDVSQMKERIGTTKWTPIVLCQLRS